MRCFRKVIWKGETATQRSKQQATCEERCIDEPVVNKLGELSGDHILISMEMNSESIQEYLSLDVKQIEKEPAAGTGVHLLGSPGMSQLPPRENPKEG